MHKRIFISAIFLIMIGCGAPASSVNTSHLSTPQPPSSQELFSRGVALAEQGQLVRAEQYLSLAVSRGYPEEAALPIILKVCLAASRIKAALNYTEIYLNRHPEDWKLRYLAASLYIGLEQPQRALAELNRVTTNDPSYAPAHYLLAILMRDSYSNSEAAANQFHAYLKLDLKGEHVAEAKAWLREYDSSQDTPVQSTATPQSAPAGGTL